MLNALSTFDFDGVTAAGTYAFTVPDFIRSDVKIPVADLSACTSPSFLYGLDEPGSADEVATLRLLPPGASADGWKEFACYFAPGSFQHVGPRRLGHAGRVVVHQDRRAGVEEQRLAQHPRASRTPTSHAASQTA